MRQAIPSGKTHEYVYSLSRQTFAPTLTSRPIVPLLPIGKVAIISDGHVLLTDRVPTLPPLSKEELVAQINEEITQANARSATLREQMLRPHVFPKLQSATPPMSRRANPEVPR